MQQGGVGLGGHSGQGPLHGGEQTRIIGIYHRSRHGVGLVGQHRHIHPRGLQPGDEVHHAGIGGGLVLLMGIVPGGELLQGFFQGGFVPVPLRGKALHQLGDTVAHHALILLHGVLRPAPPGAHPVARIGQVVDGIQQSAVQIKDHILIHAAPSAYS